MIGNEEMRSQRQREEPGRKGKRGDNLFVCYVLYEMPEEKVVTGEDTE